MSKSQGCNPISRSHHSWSVLRSARSKRRLFSLLILLPFLILTLFGHCKHMNLRCPEELPTLHSVEEGFCDSPSGAFRAQFLISSCRSSTDSFITCWSCTGFWRRICYSVECQACSSPSTHVPVCLSITKLFAHSTALASEFIVTAY